MMILKTSRSNLSSNDQLTLDLPFAATKSLTARVGPTPTFTRASAATYFGPLVDYANIAFSTTGVSNGRASWFKSEAGEDITISYTGARWRIHTISGEFESEFLAAVGSEWRPDQANWSASGAFSPVTTSSTFGIVKAATNEPRFDHNITAPNACRGLLIEESRTNICLQSENFGTTWTAVQLNTTGTPAYLNVATAPDGATTADKLIATTSSTTHQFRRDVTLVGGTSYTISVYFKAVETNFATISVIGTPNGNVDWVSYFNISTASPEAGQFNGFARTSLVDVGNGWRRCSVTFTATASGTLNTRFGGAASANIGSNFYAGDGTSGFLLWGAQLEAGSFPTSYIPTTTGSAVRSADVCSITGANFTSFYNQVEGTALVKTIGGDSTSSRELFRFESASAPFDSIFISGYSRFLAAEVSIVTNNSQQFIHFSSFSREYERLGLAYAQNNAAYSRNGSIAATDNSVITSSSIIRLLLGNNGINGCISSFSYYKKRLPNIKVNSLTAS
jgi:hypothetical protein